MSDDLLKALHIQPKVLDKTAPSSGGSFVPGQSFIRHEISQNASVLIEKSSLQKTLNTVCVCVPNTHCTPGERSSVSLGTQFEVRENGANMYRQMLVVILKDEAFFSRVQA